MTIYHTRAQTISVLIPTYNSEKTLGECLKSVITQDHSPEEIIVVDSYSHDSTQKIAKQFGCRIITTRWKILGARYLGARAAKGKYVLMLDSDQVLKRKDVLSRSLPLLRKYDMLVFEEKSYRTDTLLERLADADRRLVHAAGSMQLDPTEGTLLPRLFDRQLLLKAFKHIDMQKLHDVVVFDDALIYYEAHKISDRVSMINDAVVHKEPTGLLAVLRHNYRYGASVRMLLKYGEYNQLLAKKARFRKVKITKDNLGLAIQSYVLLILKGTAYELGKLTG